MLQSNASKYQLAPDLTIRRLLNGLWQVSGAHGHIQPEKAVEDMIAYHHAGFTTWNAADHYGPAEKFIGQFRQQLVARSGRPALQDMQILTGWSPRPASMTRPVVEQAVDIALRRMSANTIDLFQLHWWDYKTPHYHDALQHLMSIQQDGKVRYLGLTNFDTDHLRGVVEDGIPILTNQVSYSMIDRRAEQRLLPYCRARGIHLLAYGVLAGGLLTDRYLHQPEPTWDQLETASLRRYKGIINRWGGWALFQQLLRTLRQIADRHQVSIANVAVRYVLDTPGVAGVILGTRLGIREHRRDNSRVFHFRLDASDIDRIHRITDNANDLYRLMGDCGTEHRI